MNRALRRRHRRLWSALVLVLVAVGVLAWRRADGQRAPEAAAAQPSPISSAPLGDAVP